MYLTHLADYVKPWGQVVKLTVGKVDRKDDKITHDNR